jgi:putative flippase GtrA
MKQLRDYLITVIDFLYPPFRGLMPLQTFRYAACGGGNTLLDILLYFISYNFILHKQVVHFGSVAVSPHIAAFLFSFCFTFPIGFILSSNIVFNGSALRRRIQLFRYFVVVLGAILLNYIFLKLFVEQFHFYPTIAKICTTVIVVTYSYFSQRHYSFRPAAGNN